MKLGLKSAIGLFIFIIISSIFLAYLEIQIEGTVGWAKNLPTWKYKISNFEITGYHLSLWGFLFIICHFPLFFTSWSLTKESFIISFFIILLLVEDSFWFLLNKEFKGLNDEWRQPKLGSIPMFFIVGAFFALFFALCSYSLYWFISVLILLTLCTISFPFQISYH
jgi:hypothetical protein